MGEYIYESLQNHGAYSDNKIVAHSLLIPNKEILIHSMIFGNITTPTTINETCRKK